MDSLPFSAAGAPAIPIHAIRSKNWSAWIEREPAPLQRLAAAQDFKAQAGRTLIVPAPDGTSARVLFGLSDSANPLALGALASSLPEADYVFAETPAEFDSTLIAIAWGLGAYAFSRYKPRKRAAPRLAPPSSADIREAQRLLTASYLARDLVNTPTNDMGPDALHAEAVRVAHAGGAKLNAIVGHQLLEQNYPLIHAVGRAAAQPPRLIHIAWGEENEPRLALIGKGVTFDTGGLDIKPSSGMRWMKKDMGGAAHALALASIVMDAKLPVRLDVFIPIAENAISADAFRPGDVIKSRKGLTVEIDNTDAEGRLILADALARAGEDNPALLFNFATLTGAARVALGPDLPPFYTDDETLAAELAEASRAEHDPIWRLPLWNDYDPDIETQIADLKNGGEAGMAGSITAALFLRRFATAQSWAHFDIFAWSPRDRPSRPKGGEAQTLRACWSVLKQRFG